MSDARALKDAVRVGSEERDARDDCVDVRVVVAVCVGIAAMAARSRAWRSGNGS